jgi:hypothetical protein
MTAVARGAEWLPVAPIPECLVIALVRTNVIDHGCGVSAALEGRIGDQECFALDIPFRVVTTLAGARSFQIGTGFAFTLKFFSGKYIERQRRPYGRKRKYVVLQKA